MPSSPCGPNCVEAVDRVGTARLAGRLAQVAGLLVSFPVVNAITPRGRREAVQRGYAQALLGCLGMRLRVVDNRVAAATVSETARPDLVSHIGTALRRDDRGARDGADPVRFAPKDTGVLVITGHIGWTDVVVLAAVQPLGFVARADLIDWPLLGRLAKLMRIIPIEREKLRALPGVVDTIAGRLAAGDRIAAFPEGTTWCGRAFGRMRPALFQAAVDAGAYVQPVRLRYLDRDGAQCTVCGFVGEDTFASSAARILRSRGMVAEITLEPLEYPGLDRRDLARRCENAVRGSVPSRHGGADTEWIEASATRVQDPAPAVPQRAPGQRGPGMRRRAVALFRGRGRDAKSVRIG
ncbi:1-acyl-sn-glycerol-3-phosphate acyltransferase [Nocardia sp. NEAU-351]|uniref:1-acyl-sn-glycerol-3-phosphate acyltransferase n=2 Tax=Nocardia bovistercoris TaxID=2785916 RepID=A0A931IIX9_9NOCA|nr:lysophospholipid acyltransferase family protein [Nocardia bovistercoris]MBH0781453.1 1-acyl-sn-glycerol-3-phosphate acyltransferase [Nocardia bovistercoris]